MLPGIVVGLALYVFYISSELGLARTMTGLIVGHVIVTCPFVIATVTAALVGFENQNSESCVFVNPADSPNQTPLTTSFCPVFRQNQGGTQPATTSNPDVPMGAGRSRKYLKHTITRCAIDRGGLMMLLFQTPRGTRH